MWIVLWISLNSLAFSSPAASPPADLLRFYPDQVLRNEIVEFKPVKGHHFSAEAPQACGTGALNERNARAVKCQFTAPGATEATLNVCDDKQTYCKPLGVKITVSEKAGATPVQLTKNQMLNQDLHKKLVPGFSEGTREEIFKQAAERGQPVFVMISTDWCPPCNEAKEYLLTSDAFHRASQNWLKVYIDGDSVGAADWEKAIPYRYFPSFILLNAKMQEVAHYNGEIRQADFEAWSKDVAPLVDDPIVAVKARVEARLSGSFKQKIADLLKGVGAEKKHKEAARLLYWALDQQDRPLVAKILKSDKFPEFRAEIASYQGEDLERREGEEGVDLKAEKLAVGKDLLDATFKGEHWAEALANLCGIDAAECKPYFAKINERQDFLRTRPGLTDAERESAFGDESVYLTEAYQEAGDKDAAKAYALKCVDHFDAMKQKSQLKLSRAGSQGMVACLEMAGQFDREEKLLNELMAAYPSEPTFMNRMARMMRKQKKYDEALRWIAKAENLAYGYNWFMLETIKADVLLDMKKNAEAKQAVHEALAQVDLDGDKSSRNQGLVARLRALEAKAVDTK